MERGHRDLKIKEASAFEGVDNPTGNDEVLAGLLATKATLAGAEKTRKEGEADASASEVGMILKLKKEAMMISEPTSASKKKKIAKQRLSKEFLDFLVATPYKPVGDLSEETLALHSPAFRKCYATEKAKADRYFTYQQALVDQYLANGYADDEYEVTDDEEEEEN